MTLTTVIPPLDQYSEVVDERRRWRPDWYSWLRSIESSTSGGTAPFVNIVDYGGIGDGVADNTAAFTAAIAALGSMGGTIYFPRGRFVFSSNQVVNYPLNSAYDLTIIGDGQDATRLFWPVGVHGLNINFNTTTTTSAQSFHARDLSFITDDVPASNRIGLNLNQVGTLTGAYIPYSEITRVVFMGFDGPVAFKGWGSACNCADISNVMFQGCAFFGTATPDGTGVIWAGLNSSNIATGLYFISCAINNFTTGVLMNDFAQGMYFTSCQINGCIVGISLFGGASDTDSAVSIVNSEFGVYATNAAAITMTNPVAFFQVDSTNFNMPGISGPSSFINLGATANVQITSCSFIAPAWPGAGTVGTKLTGISLSNTVATTGTLIANNLIAGFSGNGFGVNASTAIVIQASADNVQISSNTFIANQTVGATTSCINNAGTNVYVSDNSYDTGFGPILSKATGDAARVTSDKLSEIYGNVTGNSGVNLGNKHGAVNDHAVGVFGGSTGNDSSTVMVNFVNPNAVQVGSISRIDNTGLSYNGSRLNLTGGTGTSVIDTSAAGVFALSVRNSLDAVSAQGIAIRAGTTAATDATTLCMIFNDPSVNQCGTIARADAAGVRHVSYNTSSDGRLKKNVRGTARGLKDLRRIRVIDYGLNGDAVQGLIAQEVVEVYPEAVRRGGENAEKEPWQMDYGRITPLLVQAIKDLSDKVERLEKRLTGGSDGPN